MKRETPDPAAATPIDDYHPIALTPRRDGWTADRQRLFLTALAETGCVSVACHEADITSRSAYRLRAHAKGAAFAAAWDQALLVATGRLTALAFERAANGVPRELWRDGKLIAETRMPSDKLLMFLLKSLIPHQFGGISTMNAWHDRRVAGAQRQFPGKIDALADIDIEPESLGVGDYLAKPPAEEIA